MSLGVIKTKFNQLKEEEKNLYSITDDLNEKINSHRALNNDLEKEMSSRMNQLKRLQFENSNIQNRLRDTLEKIKALEKFDQDEPKENLIEDEDEIRERLKVIKKEADESGLEYELIYKKLISTQMNTKRFNDLAEAKEKKISELKLKLKTDSNNLEQINQNNEQVKDISANESFRTKDEKLEQEIENLERKLKLRMQKVDSDELTITMLDRQISQSKSELESWKSKTKSVKDELNQLMDVIGKIQI